MNKYFPVNINLKSQKCLVVGGGLVAERKVLSLVGGEAKVVIVTPKLTAKLKHLHEENKIECINRSFEMSDLEEVFLVICATNNEALNKQIADKCLEDSILVNVVDDPSKCNFLVPAVVRQGPLCISISTGGASPVLARKIREDLEKEYGLEYSGFLDLLREIRPEIINKYKDPEVRKRVFECLVYSDILDLIRNGDNELVRERIIQCLEK